MQPKDIAALIATNTDNGHWRTIVAEELIDQLASAFEAEKCCNWDGLICAIHAQFNRAAFIAQCKGEGDII